MKIKISILLLFILSFYTGFGHAQLRFYDNKTDKEYEITDTTDKAIVDKYLESINAKAIEFNSNKNSSSLFRIKNSKGIWQINDINNIEELYYLDKYSQNFPSPIMEEMGITTVSKKNKNYIFSFETENVFEAVPFHKIRIYTNTDTIYEYKNELEKTSLKTRLKYIALQKDNFWALAYYSKEDFKLYQLTKFKYPNEKELHECSMYKYLENLSHPLYPTETETLSFIHDELLNHKSKNTSVEYKNFSKYPIRIKDQKGNWRFYEVENYSPLLSKNQQKKYRLMNTSKDIEKWNVGIVERKSKKYIISFQEGNNIYHETWFDDIEIIEKTVSFYPDYPIMTSEGEDSLDIHGNYVFGKETYSILEKLLLQRDGKYALAFMDSYNNTLYQLSGFHFESTKNVPNLDYFSWEDPYTKEITNNYETMAAAHNILQELSSIDLIVPITFSELNNSDVFKVRNNQTKRWSIQMENGFKADQTLPIAASKIEFIDNGNPIYVVWCDNKVGFYNKTFQHFKPCEYDDFKHIFLDSQYGCALKKDGKWQLFDTQSADKLIKEKAKTIDELKQMWWNR
ncbi:hypothetical protein [Brumimicrobium aurantiacum]|nr:hypothetical protein [Brumimicrobium aurantiacum]